MRIRCYLFGCWCDENSACPKCGAALYDVDFIQDRQVRLGDLDMAAVSASDEVLAFPQEALRSV
jgi:hypothetical protein